MRFKLVLAVGCIPNTCRRQVRNEEEGLTRQAIQSSLSITMIWAMEGGLKVAQAIRRLIRDRLAAGEADVIVA